MVTVAIDVMGSDLGVSELIKGITALSMEADNQIQMVLVGDAKEIAKALVGQVYHPKFIEIVHASQHITQDEKAKEALKTNQDLSIVRACQLVKEGRADALVSAGNTGGVILSAAQSFDRIAGVQRVALAAVLPTEKRRGQRQDPFALLLDVGATLHVTAEDLYRFALMGSIYASIVSKNTSPSVALLSNGTEIGKGPSEVVEAFQLLSENTDGLSFIGNVEGLDIPRGGADVIVCEGFLGNVVLKLLEGITELAADLAKEAYDSKLIWRLGLTMLSKELRKLRRLTDWKQYGGAPILGFDKVVIKAHGRSNARAIRNAIKLAAKVHRGDLISKIQQKMEPRCSPTV